MQRQQLLSSVIELFYCPKTKVIATYGGFQKEQMGTLKKRQTREITFKILQSSVLDLVTQPSFLSPPPRPPALVGNHKRLATEKTNQQKNKKKTLGAPLVACISKRSGENENYCCSTSPLLPTREHLWGSADCSLSEWHRWCVCIIQHGSCIKHERGSAVGVHWPHSSVIPPSEEAAVPDVRLNWLSPRHHHHLQKQHRATTVYVACLQVAMRFRLKKHESASSILILMQSWLIQKGCLSFHMALP